MGNPVSNILRQCPGGFTIRKKVGLTLGIGLYLLSPLDLIPEPLVPLGIVDDGVALFVLIRVWLSPTLHAGRYYSPPSSPPRTGVPAPVEFPG